MCNFSKDRIPYLGHITSEEGISMDPDKIEAIKNWPTRNNVIEVRSFMGLARYYGIFIEILSKVAHAIASLQMKGIKFEWNSKCEESFQWLKYLLTSAPILKVADPEKYFVVCVAAIQTPRSHGRNLQATRCVLGGKSRVKDVTLFFTPPFRLNS